MNIIKKISLITIILICILIGKSFAKTGTITASAVRIRSEMNTQSNIITNIYEDDEVEILEENGEWYKIKYGESTGYVKKEFIKISNTESTNTVNNNNNNNNTNSALENNSNTNTNPQTSNIKEENSQLNSQDSSSENANNKSNIVTTNTVVTIKINPNLMSTTVAQFEQGKELTKVYELNKWIKVTDGSVSGWLTKAKITEINNKEENNNPKEPENKVEDKIENKIEEPKETTNTTNTTNASSTTNRESSSNKKGTVNVETANVRQSASTDSSIIGFLDYGDTVTIILEEGDWYKVIGEDASGYVSKRLITVSENKNMTSRSLTEERKEEKIENTETEKTKIPEKKEENITTVSNNEIAEYAKKYLGCKYIVGGKNPQTGFDCSGFTRYVYLNFGYSLGTTSSSQSNSGTQIERENMQVGDLIIFYNEEKSSVGHTGIYLGNGDFIHSANPERGVVIDNLNTNTYYNERFISARRIAE